MRLAAAARIAGDDPAVQKVLICAPDKDLAQCVRGTRVVQWHRRTNKIVDTKLASWRGVRRPSRVDPGLPRTSSETRPMVTQA